MRGFNQSSIYKFFARLVLFESGMDIPSDNDGLVVKAGALLQRRRRLRQGILEEPVEPTEEELQGLDPSLRAWALEIAAHAPPPPTLAPFCVPGRQRPTLYDSDSLRAANGRLAWMLGEAAAFHAANSGAPNAAGKAAVRAAANGVFEANEDHKATCSMLRAATAARLPSDSTKECFVQALALWSVVDREEFPREYELRTLEVKFAAEEFGRELHASAGPT